MAAPGASSAMASWSIAGARSLYNVQSATKTFGSVLLGFAVDDGKVSLTAPAQRYLSGIGATPTSNVAKGWLDEIRVDHLATHTAGFPKSRLPSALAARPGTKYIYSDGGTNWLAALLTKAFGQDLRALAQSRLFSPIGVPSSAAKWSLMDAQYRMPPTCRFNGGMLASVDTMARLGYLYLNNGNWNGKQIVSTAPMSSSRPAPTNRASRQVSAITGCCGGFPVSPTCDATTQAASTTIIPSSFPLWTWSWSASAPTAGTSMAARPAPF